MQELFKNGTTISYGKRKNLAPGIVEDYLILPDSTKGFTSDEKNNFEKICKSFSWTSTSNPGEILPPCYGFFPFGDGSSIIVARFIDDGRDNQGRADLLRVDAIKVPAQLFHELKSDLRLVFDSSIWKNIFAVENSMADSIVISADDCDKVFALVKKNITTPLLVGCSKNFKFKPISGKFNTFDINSKTIEEISVPIVSPPSNPRISLPPPKQNSTAVVKINWLILVSKFAVILGLVWYAYDLKFIQIEKINEKHRIEKDSLIETINDKEREIKNHDVKIAGKIEIIEKRDKRIDDLEKSKGKFPVDEIIKKLGTDPSNENARKVLSLYENDAIDSFNEIVKVKFSESQKQFLDKWLKEAKIPKSKVNKSLIK